MINRKPSKYFISCRRNKSDRLHRRQSQEQVIEIILLSCKSLPVWLLVVKRTSSQAFVIASNERRHATQNFWWKSITTVKFPLLSVRIIQAWALKNAEQTTKESEKERKNDFIGLFWMNDTFMGHYLLSHAINVNFSKDIELQLKRQRVHWFSRVALIDFKRENNREQSTLSWETWQLVVGGWRHDVFIINNKARISWFQLTWTR